MKQAADAAGVGLSSFLRWMRVGDDVVEEKQGGRLDVDSPDPCAALYARVTRARAAAAVRATGSIEEAARGAVVSETYRTWTDPSTGETRSERRIRRRPGDWRASAWLLVRLDPEPKSLDELLDEEDARIRAERGENSMGGPHAAPARHRCSPAEDARAVRGGRPAGGRHGSRPGGHHELTSSRARGDRVG